MAANKPKMVRLIRNNSGINWGFRLFGGQDYGIPMVIHSIVRKSIAERCGLRPGDKVLAINGLRTSTATHTMAKMEIVRTGMKLVLVILRDPNCPEPVLVSNNSDVPLEMSPALQMEQEDIKFQTPVIHNTPPPTRPRPNKPRQSHPTYNTNPPAKVYTTAPALTDTSEQLSAAPQATAKAPAQVSATVKSAPIIQPPRDNVTIRQPSPDVANSAPVNIPAPGPVLVRQQTPPKETKQPTPQPKEATPPVKATSPPAKQPSPPPKEQTPPPKEPTPPAKKPTPPPKEPTPPPKEPTPPVKEPTSETIDENRQKALPEEDKITSKTTEDEVDPAATQEQTVDTEKSSASETFSQQPEVSSPAFRENDPPTTVEPEAEGPLKSAVPNITHAQYNSPMGLYSAENIAQSYALQTEGIKKELDKQNAENGQNISPTLQLIQESEQAA